MALPVGAVERGRPAVRNGLQAGSAPPTDAPGCDRKGGGEVGRIHQRFAHQEWCGPRCPGFRGAIAPAPVSRHRWTYPHRSGGAGIPQRYVPGQAGEAHRHAVELPRLHHAHVQLAGRHAAGEGRLWQRRQVLSLRGLAQGTDRHERPLGRDGARHGGGRRETQ